MGKQLHLFKYMSLARMERVLDVLLNERLYCANYSDLNDPFEGQFLEEIPIDPNGPFRVLGWLNGGKFIERRNVGSLPSSASGLPRICSLSFSRRDVRLWSYYADSHRGIAIEIDFSGAESSVHKVTYKPKIDRYSIDSSIDRPVVEKILTEKTEHWQFEEEYRILSDKDYFLINGRIRAVHLGIRAGAEIAQLLRKATGARFQLVYSKLDLEKAEVVEDRLLTTLSGAE